MKDRFRKVEIDGATSTFADKASSAFRNAFGYQAPSIVPWAEGACAFDGGTKKLPERYFRVIAKRDGTFSFSARDADLWGIQTAADTNGFTAAYESAVELARTAHSKTRGR